MEEKIKILIVDDHEMIRSGLKLLLSGHEEFSVLAEAGNGFEALEVLEQQKIDIVLLDINMPKMNGLVCAQEIQKLHPKIKMLVVTMHDDDQHIKNMLKYGALGYILKNSKEEILVKAIKTVYKGEAFFGEDVSNTLWDMKNIVTKPSSSGILITEREKEILRLLVKSKNDLEISEILAISSRTLLAHKRNLFQKTGSEDVVELSKYANEHNLLQS